MNWITCILVFVLTLRSERKLFDVERVFLVENDFWSSEQNQLKTEKGYLYEVGVGLKHKDGFTDGFDYHIETCYALKSTNLGYLVLKDTVRKDILKFLESPEDEKFLFKFLYLFSDDPNVNLYDFQSYKGKVHGYVTYKLLKKEPENKNSISLKCDVTDNYTKHLKEKFKVSLSKNLLRFNRYIKILNEMNKEQLSKRKEDAKFGLYYFKNHSECLESLDKLIKDLGYIRLLRKHINTLTAESSGMIINNTTTLAVSDLKDRLSNKFNENLKKLNNVEIDEIWENLFNECFYCIENMMLKNHILYSVGGKYDIDYYIEQFSSIIYESTKERHREYAIAIPAVKYLISSEIAGSLVVDLEKLQSKIVQGLCETEYVPKHFSKLLGKEVETFDDYNEIERMVIDYLNMFEHITSLNLRSNKKICMESLYYNPISTDNYNMRIIDGIKILINNMDKFENIKGLNKQEEEVVMVKDTDYFINENIIYFPSVVLKMKNIQEIEVNLLNEKNSMRFEVNKYLKE